MCHSSTTLTRAISYNHCHHRHRLTFTTTVTTSPPHVTGKTPRRREMVLDRLASRITQTDQQLDFRKRQQQQQVVMVGSKKDDEGVESTGYNSYNGSLDNGSLNNINCASQPHCEDMNAGRLSPCSSHQSLEDSLEKAPLPVSTLFNVCKPYVKHTHNYTIHTQLTSKENLKVPDSETARKSNKNITSARHASKIASLRK